MPRFDLQGLLLLHRNTVLTLALTAPVGNSLLSTCVSLGPRLTVVAHLLGTSERTLARPKPELAKCLTCHQNKEREGTFLTSGIKRVYTV